MIDQGHCRICDLLVPLDAEKAVVEHGDGDGGRCDGSGRPCAFLRIGPAEAGASSAACPTCAGTGHAWRSTPLGSCLSQPYSPVLSCCHGCPTCGGSGDAGAHDVSTTEAGHE